MSPVCCRVAAHVRSVPIAHTVKVITFHFHSVSEGTHTVSGNGKMAGQVLKCEFWACKKKGCARGNAKPIKHIGSGTADLYSHLDSCQPNLAQELRVVLIHSPARIGEDGESVSA